MLVPWADLNSCHTTTAQCTNIVERKHNRLAAEDMRASTERTFQDYNIPLNSVTSFK